MSHDNPAAGDTVAVWRHDTIKSCRQMGTVIKCSGGKGEFGMFRDIYHMEVEFNDGSRVIGKFPITEVEIIKRHGD